MLNTLLKYTPAIFVIALFCAQSPAPVPSDLSPPEKRVRAAFMDTDFWDQLKISLIFDEKARNYNAYGLLGEALVKVPAELKRKRFYDITRDIVNDGWATHLAELKSVGEYVWTAATLGNLARRDHRFETAKFFDHLNQKLEDKAFRSAFVKGFVGLTNDAPNSPLISVHDAFVADRGWIAFSTYLIGGTSHLPPDEELEILSHALVDLQREGKRLKDKFLTVRLTSQVSERVDQVMKEHPELREKYEKFGGFFYRQFAITQEAQCRATLGQAARALKRANP